VPKVSRVPRLKRCALAALAAVAIQSSAQAQDFPNRPITLVLPLGAGGAMDIVARGSLGPKLAERLGKAVVIENRTGGGTVIAANAVAKACRTATRCCSARPARSPPTCRSTSSSLTIRPRISCRSR